MAARLCLETSTASQSQDAIANTLSSLLGPLNLSLA